MIEEIKITQPDISSVLKALNHELRREILLYLNEYKRGSFTALHTHVEERTKSTGQFSYHLKMLIDAGIISKQDDSYTLTQLGERATSMITMIDTEVRQPSIAQKISNSYSQLSPLESILISWMIAPLIIFAVIMSGFEVVRINPITYLLYILGAVILLIISFVFMYSKLNYLPSMLALSSVVWILFLEKNHIQLGSMYLFSGVSVALILQGLIFDVNQWSVLLGCIMLVINFTIGYFHVKSQNAQIIDIKIN
ncbi:MAG: helix-turn-helix transcriptional regulator [Candidatus Heimdallarchaeota archaeon]|nr:helix-turn-helix transcriptional regulator [Candidatus Heimdallarchaeota archaeon]